MKAMTILTRCRNAEVDKRRIKQRITQRREAAESITPQVDTIGGGRGTSAPDKIAGFVAAIDGLEAEMDAREQARCVEMAAACVLLDTLPGTESAVLHQYYVKRQKVPAIAKKMDYTEGYIRRLKAEGEKLVAAIPPAQVEAALPPWYLRDWPERKTVEQILKNQT